MTDIGLIPLIQFYTIAPTPAYLLRTFSENEELQRYAVRTSEAELLQHYYTAAENPLKEVEDVAWCYACIVALKLKGAALVNVPPYDLDWVEELKVL